MTLLDERKAVFFYRAHERNMERSLKDTQEQLTQIKQENQQLLEYIKELNRRVHTTSLIAKQALVHSERFCIQQQITSAEIQYRSIPTDVPDRISPLPISYNRS